MSHIEPVTERSGQKRINAKRTNRARFWAEERRTVRVLCAPEVEAGFRAHLHLLGRGARIDACTYVDEGFGPTLHLDLHIPGAPEDAAKAAPIYASTHSNGKTTVWLDGIEWFDADGKQIAREGLSRCDACNRPLNDCPVSDPDAEWTTDANGNHDGLCCEDCWHPNDNADLKGRRS